MLCAKGLTVRPGCCLQFQPTDLRQQPLCPHTTSSQGCPCPPALLYLSLPLVPLAGHSRAWPGWQLWQGCGRCSQQQSSPQPSAPLMPLVPLPTALAGWPAWARLSLLWHSAPRPSPIPSTQLGELLGWLQTGAVTQKERQVCLPRAQDRAGHCDGGRQAL